MYGYDRQKVPFIKQANSNVVTLHVLLLVIQMTGFKLFLLHRSHFEEIQPNLSPMCQ